MDVHRETLRLTAGLLVASVCLIAPGLGSLGASLPLGLALLALGGSLAAVRRRIAFAAVVAGHDIDPYLTALWFGPLAAGVVCLGSLGASPAELQALGGLLGLVGMANYFLRPVYRLAHGFVRTAVGA
jgi:hypothetical protein